MTNVSAEAVIQQLLDDGFGNLLKDPAVRSACLSGLAHAGCAPPSNYFLLFCFDKMTGAGAGFLSGAIKSRLAAFAANNKTISALLDKIGRICRKTRDEEALKKMLLAELQDGDAAAEAPPVDAAMSLDVLQTLYQNRALSGLETTLAEVHSLMRDDVAELLKRLDHDRIDPVLGWNTISGSTETMSIVDRIRFNSGVHPFVGREDTLDLLGAFLGDVSYPGPLARFRWLLLTGAGGEGKTRLAMHFTTHLPENWIGGKMALEDVERFRAGDWMPRQPTCIVIDYPAQKPAEIGQLMAQLQRRATLFDWPVRILLVERDADNRWIDKMLPPTSSGAAVRSHAYRIDGVRAEDGISLQPLDRDSIVTLMARRFEANGLEVPGADLLWSAACKVDRRIEATGADAEASACPRALFAAATAEMLIASASGGNMISDESIAKLDAKTILDGILDRDRAEHWRILARDTLTLQDHEHLAALSTMTLGLHRSWLSDLPAPALELLPDLGRKGSRPLDVALLSSIVPVSGTFIGGLEPDILGEYFVIRTLRSVAQEDPDAAIALVSGAFQLDGRGVATFLGRLQRDFPDDAETIVDMVLAMPVSDVEEALDRATMAFELAKANQKNRGAFDGARVLARVKSLRLRFPESVELAIEEADTALKLCAMVRWKNWTAALRDETHTIFSSIAEVRDLHPDNERLAGIELYALEFIITAIDPLDDLKDTFWWLRRAVALPEKHPSQRGRCEAQCRNCFREIAPNLYRMLSDFIGQFTKLYQISKSYETELPNLLFHAEEYYSDTRVAEVSNHINEAIDTILCAPYYVDDMLNTNELKLEFLKLLISNQHYFIRDKKLTLYNTELFIELLQTQAQGEKSEDNIISIAAISMAIMRNPSLYENRFKIIQYLNKFISEYTPSDFPEELQSIASWTIETTEQILNNFTNDNNITG